MFKHFVARLSVERNLITVFAIFVVFITNVSVLFDVPISRQVFGFTFLTILPGLLLFQFPKIRETPLLEKIVLCWGVSIAFVMFYTLLINGVLPELGNAAPLSSSTLLFSFDCALLVLVILLYRTKNTATVHLPRFQITNSSVYLYAIALFFPLLSVIGSYINNVTNDNAVLLILFFLIPAYVAFVCLSKKKRPKSLYPFAVLSISLSLLLLVSLRSSHIIGADLNLEYYQYVSILGDHSMVLGPSLQSLSSLYAGGGSIALPVAYQLILGMDREVLFKSIYALLFVLVPLMVYLISTRYVEERYALIASFVYMAEAEFIGANYDSRTTIAILFFACAFVVLFSSRKTPTSGRLLFIVFVAAGIISHYATAYLFLFMMAIAVIILAIVRQRKPLSAKIDAPILFLYFSIMFLWWAFITASSAIYYGVQFVQNSLIGVLFDFFTLGARSNDTQALFGAGIGQKTVAAQTEFVLTWALFACVAIGLIVLILKRKEMTTVYGGSRPSFLRTQFEADYFAFALAAGGILLLAVVVPNGGFYSLQRTYFFTMTILSVFFVIGVIVLANWSTRFLGVIRTTWKKYTSPEQNVTLSRGAPSIRPHLALLVAMIILVPYFVCVSGAFYSIEGAPRSVLDSQGITYLELYIHNQDADAAKWIGVFGNNATVSAADAYGKNRLVSEGHISADRIDASSFQNNVTSTQFIYLYYANVVQQKYIVNNTAFNLADHSIVYSNKSRVYDAGASQAYLGLQGVA
jgi:uncharacterized membrane protein